MPKLLKALDVVRNYMSQIQKYLLTTFIFFFGCNNSESVTKSNEIIQASWLYLSIRTNAEEFSILNQDDSLLIRPIPDSVNKNSSVLAFKLTSPEKDSLFKWTETLIENKKLPSHFCTDYYGKLYLRIVYNEQVTKRIDYASICEWKDLDSTSSRIYQLITKKRGH